MITRLWSKRHEKRGYTQMIQGNHLPTSAFYNYDSATPMSVPAVFACVNLVAGTLSTFDMIIKDRSTGLEKTDRYRQRLIEMPNDNMSLSTLLKLVVKDMLLYGNSYVEITDGGTKLKHHAVANVVANVHMNREIINYSVMNDKAKITKTIKPSSMLHFKDTFLDDAGTFGLNRLTVFSSLWKQNSGANNHITDYLLNGIFPSIWLKIMGRMKKDDVEQLREDFQNTYSGIKNKNSIPVLTDGMELMPIATGKLVDSDIMNLKKSQAKDIAQIFGVPFSMLDSDSSKYSSSEENNNAFLRTTLQPIMTSIADELNLKINGSSQNIYAFDASKYIQGTYAEMLSTLGQGVKSGVITANDARVRIGLSEHDDGDILYVPAGASDRNNPTEIVEDIIVEKGVTDDTKK